MSFQDDVILCCQIISNLFHIKKILPNLNLLKNEIFTIIFILNFLKLYNKRSQNLWFFERNRKRRALSINFTFSRLLLPTWSLSFMSPAHVEQIIVLFFSPCQYLLVSNMPSLISGHNLTTLCCFLILKTFLSADLLLRYQFRRRKFLLLRKLCVFSFPNNFTKNDLKGDNSSADTHL